MLVVDASVAIKWVVPERGDAEVDSTLALATIEKGLIAPELLLAEFANAMWKKVARREIGERQAVEAMAILPELIAFRPIGAFAQRALEIGIALDHPVYDCLYLAMAEADGSRLVTADRRLLNRCAGTIFAASVADLADAAAWS